MIVTASVHVYLVWLNCGNHVGGAEERQLSNFFLGKDVLMNSSPIFVPLCVFVCGLAPGFPV